MGERSVLARPRKLRALSGRCCRCELLLSAKEFHDAFAGVLEARMRSVSVGVDVDVPLQARTVLEMVHLDGRVGWCARELCALSEALLQASFVCKGIP